MGTLRLVDGDTEIVLRPASPSPSDGIYCESFDIGYPEPRDISEDLAGQSGKLDSTVFFGDSKFTAKLKVTDNDSYTRHQLLDALRAICHPAKRPYIYAQLDGWSEERRAVLRANPLSYVVEPKSVARVEVSLQFSIPLGVYESADEYSGVLYPDVGTGSGMTFDVTFDMDFGVGSSGDTGIIDAGGNVSTPPRFLVYGPVTDPVIFNGGTGEVIAFKNITVPQGSYLDIDVANRTVYLDSTPTNSRYQYLDFDRSSWWDLLPGSNLITFSATNPGSTAQLLVVYRSRWI